MEGRYKEQWKQDRVILIEIYRNKFTDKMYIKTVDYIHIWVSKAYF